MGRVKNILHLIGCIVLSLATYAMTIGGAVLSFSSVGGDELWGLHWGLRLVVGFALLGVGLYLLCEYKNRLEKITRMTGRILGTTFATGCFVGGALAIIISFSSESSSTAEGAMTLFAGVIMLAIGGAVIQPCVEYFRSEYVKARLPKEVSE